MGLQRRESRSVWTFLPFVALAFAVLACIALSIVLTTGFNSSSKFTQLLLRLALVTPPLIWVLRQRGREETQPLRKLSLVPFFLIYVVVVMPLSWYLRDGIYQGDESSYRFQARIFRSLHAYAPAPPPEVERQFTFGTDVIFEGRWFGAFPPGWPAVLATLGWILPEWLVSPALGLVLLWLVYKIAKRLYDDRIASISVGFMACSPFFLFLSLGYYSHIANAVLVALAALLLLNAVETRRTRDLALSCASLGAAFLIRPFTAVCLGFVWASVVAWNVWHSRIRLYKALLISSFVGVIALSLFAYDNAVLTGHFWKLPYAVYFSSNMPQQLQFTFANLLHNIRTFTLKGLARTELDGVPFVLALAVYAVVKERTERSWLLAMVPLSLIIGHMFVVTESADSFVGERYYFEAYFVVTTLAAVGWVRLCQQWKPSRLSIRAVLLAATCLTLYNYVYIAHAAINYRGRFAAVYERAEQLPGAKLLVFMERGTFFFEGHRHPVGIYNPNSYGWQDSRVLFALDPGNDQVRNFTAAVMHRPVWFVLTYDPQTRGVVVKQQTGPNSE
jgi:4-amino-4-deoxy-L-arabinose transferase-like glycosyltransferase